MKILIITHYFRPHIGGIEIVAYNEAKKLIKLGHTVTVVTSRTSGGKSHEFVDGIKIIRVRALNWLEKYFDVPFPIFSFSLFVVLYDEIKTTDIVHAHGALYTGSLIGALLSKIFHKPFIVTEHVGFVRYKNNLINLIEEIAFQTAGRVTLNLSDRVLVLNQQVKKYLATITISKINYLMNGVDTQLFRPVSSKQKLILRKKYGLPKNKKLALFVGRFVEKKGIRYLIKAKTPAYGIVLVGEGALPKQTKLSKDLYIFKFLPQKDLSEIYQACNVFILPSVGEGFPLSLQEAMASGLPIITTKQEQYKKIFDPNLVLMVDQDSNQIKNSIRKILSSENESERMSQYSRNYVTKKWNWNSHTDKLVRYYQGI